MAVEAGPRPNTTPLTVDLPPKADPKPEFASTGKLPWQTKEWYDPHFYTVPRREDLVKTYEGPAITNGKDAPVVNFGKHAYDKTQNFDVPLAEELPFYNPDTTAGIVTIFGKRNHPSTYKFNKDTFAAMAAGKIPTPKELEPMIEKLKESEKGAFDIFEGYMAKKLAEKHALAKPGLEMSEKPKL